MDKCSRPKIDRDKGGRAFSFFYQLQLQPILFLLYGPIRPIDIDLNRYLRVPPITPEYELLYSPIFREYKLKKSLIPFIYLFFVLVRFYAIFAYFDLFLFSKGS